LKQEAIILRSVEYSDSSQIFTLLTPEYGKIGVMAKGLRKSKNHQQSIMEVLNYIDLVYYQKTQNQLGIVKECSLKYYFPSLRDDWGRLLAALYCAELIRECLEDNDPSPKLFQLLRFALYKLGNLGNPQNVLFYVQTHALNLLGFSPKLDQCMECGQEWPASHQMIYFLPKECGGLCESCHSQSHNKHGITIQIPTMMKLAMFLQTARQGSLDAMQFTTKESQELYHFFDQYLQVVLDKKLRLSPYIKQLCEQSIEGAIPLAKL